VRRPSSNSMSEELPVIALVSTKALHIKDALRSVGYVFRPSLQEPGPY
jgi:hypothetical protein